MHKLPLAAVIATAATLAAPAVAATPKYKATLTGKQEVPRTSSKAKGSFSFTVKGHKLTYTLKASGLSGPPQAAHIHSGKKGAAGGIIVNLSTKPFKLPLKGSVTASASALKAIKAGKAYVNIHTAKFAAGEIRGQIHKG